MSVRDGRMSYEVQTALQMGSCFNNSDIYNSCAVELYESIEVNKINVVELYESI